MTFGFARHIRTMFMSLFFSHLLFGICPRIHPHWGLESVISPFRVFPMHTNTQAVRSELQPDVPEWRLDFLDSAFVQRSMRAATFRAIEARSAQFQRIWGFSLSLSFCFFSPRNMVQGRVSDKVRTFQEFSRISVRTTVSTSDFVCSRLSVCPPL